MLEGTFQLDAIHIPFPTLAHSPFEDDTVVRRNFNGPIARIKTISNIQNVSRIISSVELNGAVNYKRLSLVVANGLTPSTLQNNTYAYVSSVDPDKKALLRAMTSESTLFATPFINLSV